MINRLRAVLDRGSARSLGDLIGWSAAAAVTQGVAFVLLVPLLQALFSDTPDDAWPWAWSLLVAVLSFAATQSLSTAAGFRLGNGLVRTIQSRLGEKIAALPVGAVDRRLSGRLARLTAKGTMEVANAPAHLVRPIINACLTPATVVVAMLVIDWRIAAAVVVCVPVLVTTYRLTEVVVGRRDRSYAAATATAGARVVEFARVQPALRAFGGTRGRSAQVEEALSEQRSTYRSMLLGGLVGMSSFIVAVQLTVTAVIVVGVWLALDGAVDVATLVALLVLTVRFAEPLTAVADLGSGIRVALNSLDEIRELLQMDTLPEPAHPTAPQDASIELREVTFGYGAAPVVRDISITVPPGTTTALVGPSGSGKSTLTRLIARFYDADSGQVLIGGRDVRELGTAATMSSVAPVFQDVYLFEGTLLDNIRLGRPDASDADVLAAGRAAAVDEIAARLPRGWDTQVGEGGGQLSGGERQRVSIARAIIKDAPIVLLDEATSALDPVNERLVTDALAALTRDRTMVVVAHRLQTVLVADQIVVLTRDGRVAERGTHPELLAADGPYAAFWHSRRDSAGWTLTPTTGATPAPAPSEES